MHTRFQFTFSFFPAVRPVMCCNTWNKCLLPYACAPGCRLRCLLVVGSSVVLWLRCGSLLLVGRSLLAFYARGAAFTAGFPPAAFLPRSQPLCGYLRTVMRLYGWRFWPRCTASVRYFVRLPLRAACALQATYHTIYLLNTTPLAACLLPCSIADVYGRAIFFLGGYAV